MTEIQQYRPSQTAALETAQDVAVHRLGEWAQSAQAAHGIAQTLVQTSFCPDSFRNKPGEATAAILAGMEMGLSPMAALRSFDVIQGQAAARAVTLRAVVQSQGHEIELVESTPAVCRMRGRRKGSTTWQEVRWTMDRARQLNLTNKPNWKNQPQTMLVARATSELARLIASDAILGLAYSAEEIADGGAPDQAETTAPASTGTRRMGRKKPEATEAAAPERDVEGQRAAMFATFNDATAVGLVTGDRADRLAYCTQVIGRQVDSSNDLTWDEVSKVIDNLKGEIAELQASEPVDGELVEDPA